MVILSKDGITTFMFLNYSTGKNYLIGKVKSTGTNIMLYGHVSQRYPERLGRVQKVTKAKSLKYNNLLNRAMKLTEEHYKECINPGREKVRHVIRDEIHFNCEDGNHFVIDLTLLVTGTMITFDPNRPKVVESQYKDLVNKRILKLDDKILTFETLATTIRFEDERLENFSHQPTVAYFGLPKETYNVTKEDIIYMTEHMLKDSDTKISKHVMRALHFYENDIRREKERKATKSF